MARQVPDRTSWAIYNFAAEADNFGFPVALAATITTAPDEPEDSSVVLMHLPGATAQASVFIHREGTARSDGRRLLPSRLEIVPALDADDISAICEQQLVMALRLFKPAFFWVAPWERRNDVWLPGRGLTSSGYSLKAQEMRRFADFAKRLGDFHVERNITSSIRYNSVLSVLFDGDMSQFLGPEDPKGDGFLRRRAYLMIAGDLYDEALREWHLSSEIRLMLLMMASEALFGDADKSELSHRLAQRAAVLLGPTATDRKVLFEFMKRLYDVRSRLMHGALYRKREGFLRIEVADLENLVNVVRASLLYFIALKATPKEPILKILDRGFFDEAEVLRLRFKANEYWGFGDSSDEHLYSLREAGG